MSADEPLRGRPYPHDRLHPMHYLAEFIGTAALVAGGLSFVILFFGVGSPVVAALPDAGLRRGVTGLLFGSTGLVISLSAVGRTSGAHINPAMTLAFWLDGKIAWRDALAYALAQFAGAALGASVLPVWGSMGASIQFGATQPNPNLPLLAPLLGEVGSTSAMVLVMFVMAAHPVTRKWVPFANPPLFAFLVWLEAPLSGTSVNPARSFGPALVAGVTHHQWIYAVGPCLGAALAVALSRSTGMEAHRPPEARLAHFTTRPHGLNG